MAGMNREAQQVCERVLVSNLAELFPRPEGDAQKVEEALKKIFRDLSRKVHPDLHGGHALAKRAFQHINDLHQTAIALYTGKVHLAEPERFEVPVQTRKATYVLRELIAENSSELSDVYRGDTVDSYGNTQRIVAKVCRDAGDNDFPQNEARILQHMWSTEKEALTRFLPKLLDRFKTEDGRFGLVFEDLSEYVSLTELKTYFPGGIESKHFAWIFKRLLSVLGFAHAVGVAHCNVCPEHIMVRPRDHNLALIDWGYAALRPHQTRETFKVRNEVYSAPEVKKGVTPKTQTDLYSAALCMIDILGGDAKTQRMPLRLESQLKGYLEGFLYQNPMHRVGDALAMHDQLEKILREQLHWPRVFHQLVLPNRS